MSSSALLISRTSANIAADLAAMRRLVPDLGSRPLCYMVEYAERAGIASSPEMAGSLYAPCPRQTFPLVALGPSVRLWQGQWSEAFLAHVFSCVAPGGFFATPFPMKGGKGWTQEQTARLLRAPLQTQGTWWPFAAAKLKGIARGEGLPPKMVSVLSWYFENAQAAIDLQLTRADDESARQALRDLADGAKDELPVALASAISGQAYYVAGIGYKAPAVANILGLLRPGRVGGRLVDVGGGYGLLAAELLFDRTLRLNEAIVVDVSTLNNELANLLLPYIRDNAQDRCFSFILSNATDYAFPAGCAVISFVGSLLYVPKEQRELLIARAFEQLEPGGVLLVHENVRAPSYVRDYELMFEPDELDRLLGTHGKVRYFASGEPKELPASRVGRSTVFRAVVKAI